MSPTGKVDIETAGMLISVTVVVPDARDGEEAIPVRLREDATVADAVGARDAEASDKVGKLDGVGLAVDSQEAKPFTPVADGSVVTAARSPVYNG